MSLTSDKTTRSAFPILDTMLEMQRIGLRAMTFYQPVAAALLDSAVSAERAAMSSFFVSPRTRIAGVQAPQDSDAEHVVAIGEEEAAANAKLVANEELESLNAKLHVGCGGRLTPYEDPHGVLAETKAGLDQAVRERAYLLWERAGRPDDRTDEFWHQAQYLRFCERAYALWEREGYPEGRADEHWHRTRAFEEI